MRYYWCQHWQRMAHTCHRDIKWKMILYGTCQMTVILTNTVCERWLSSTHSTRVHSASCVCIPVTMWQADQWQLYLQTQSLKGGCHPPFHACVLSNLCVHSCNNVAIRPMTVILTNTVCERWLPLSFPCALGNLCVHSCNNVVARQTCHVDHTTPSCYPCYWMTPLAKPALSHKITLKNKCVYSDTIKSFSSTISCWMMSNPYKSMVKNWQRY